VPPEAPLAAATAAQVRCPALSGKQAVVFGPDLAYS
jgi:hypothetical protein